MNYKRFEEIAQEHGLVTMGLAIPSNKGIYAIRGHFAYNVESYAHAKKIAKKHELAVYKAEWQDGWGYAVTKGGISEGLDITSEWFGDNYEVLTSRLDDNILDYYGCNTTEELLKCGERTYEMKMSWYSKVMKMSRNTDFSKYVVVLHDKRFQGRMNRCHFSFDGRHVAVGVAYLGGKA